MYHPVFIVHGATEFQHVKGVQNEDNHLCDHHDHLHMHPLPTCRTYRRSRIGMCNDPLSMKL
jgi:hypothetical protein